MNSIQGLISLKHWSTFHNIKGAQTNELLALIAVSYTCPCYVVMPAANLYHAHTAADTEFGRAVWVSAVGATGWAVAVRACAAASVLLAYSPRDATSSAYTLVLGAETNTLSRVYYTDAGGHTTVLQEVRPATPTPPSTACLQ